MSEIVKSISLNIDIERIELKEIKKLYIENGYIIMRGITIKDEDIAYKREFTDGELELNCKII